MRPSGYGRSSLPMITTPDEARAFLRNRFPGASDADIEVGTYMFLEHSHGPEREQYKAKARQLPWPPSIGQLRCYIALCSTNPVAPVVRSEPPKPTYFSETAKPIAADLVRRIREPLDVIIKFSEEIRSREPHPPKEQYRYVTDILASALHLAKELKELLEC